MKSLKGLPWARIQLFVKDRNPKGQSQFKHLKRQFNRQISSLPVLLKGQITRMRNFSSKSSLSTLQIKTKTILFNKTIGLLGSMKISSRGRSTAREERTQALWETINSLLKININREPDL
jgi:hypothetical protein